MSRKKEGKEKVPNTLLSLEEIEKGKSLSVEPSSKRRRLLTAEKKFDLFVESCRSPGQLRVWEIRQLRCGITKSSRA